jgi:hypothetical protein
MAKRWLLLVLTVAAAGVVGAAVAAAFAHEVLHESDLSTAWLIGAGGAVGGAAATLGAAATHARRARVALATDGPYQAAVRLVDGTSAGVSRRWTHGEVQVEAGRLHLVPFVLGLRGWRRAPVTLDVLGVRDTGRRTSGRTAVVVGAGQALAEVAVPAGTLELASSREVVERLTRDLVGTPDPQG